MAIERQDPTEFGGVPGLVFPPETGYVLKDYENHLRMVNSDSTDPASGADIVSQSVAS